LPVFFDPGWTRSLSACRAVRPIRHGQSRRLISCGGSIYSRAILCRRSWSRSPAMPWR